MNFRKRIMERSTVEDDPVEVPLEEVLSAGNGDPFFAIHHRDGSWKWEFHDEFNRVRIQSRINYCDIRETLNDIRETQKRIGNLETPILRVV